MRETIFGKVFLGGIKTGKLPDKVAKWMDDAMECGENFILSDENTLPIQSYLNAKNYRNVTVYHSDEVCHNNLGNWETKHIPDVTYKNEKNVALAYGCDCGVFVYERDNLPMRMAMKHLRSQGKSIFITYRSTTDEFKITRRA